MNPRMALMALPVLLCSGVAHAQDNSACNSGDPDSRIVACTALIQSGPGAVRDFSVPFNNRGFAYANKGQIELAILDFNAAISINPNLALAYSNRGAAFQAEGLLEQALEDYRKAITLDPNLRQAYNNRCYTLALQGHADQAMPDCDKAIELQPNDPAAFDLRAFVFYRQGRFPEAIHDLDEALKLNSTLPTALYVRGLAKLKMGNAGGKTDVDQARASDPNISRKMEKLGVESNPVIAVSAK